MVATCVVAAQRANRRSAGITPILCHIVRRFSRVAQILGRNCVMREPNHGFPLPSNAGTGVAAFGVGGGVLTVVVLEPRETSHGRRFGTPSRTCVTPSDDGRRLAVPGLFALRVRFNR